MVALFFLAGNARKRFVEVAVLLHMIDPVRGEPAAHTLDQNKIGQDREGFLKRKFLDSLALICAEQKGGEYVSAVCMEEGQPDGTTIRIARNGGVSAQVLAQVRSIIDNLNKLSSGESGIEEVGILQQIIQLSRARINNYIRDIRAIPNISIPPRTEMSRKIHESGSIFPASHFEPFFEWLDSILAVRELHADPEFSWLLWYISLAREASHNYLEPMNAVLSDSDSGRKFTTLVMKLGRYGVASRAFGRLAAEAPALFNPMIVQPIPAPSKNPVPQNEISVYAALRRLVGEHGEKEYAGRLSRIMGEAKLETSFKQHSPSHLTVHAEMQLLGFYDTHPQQMPAFRFIGVSKKSCYLCNRFLSIHSGSFTSSACHQKLYTSWTAPATSDNKVYANYKTLMSNLTCTLEDMAKRDLKHRLGNTRRPPPADSSRGVSLTGLTEHTSIVTSSLVDSQADVRQVAYQQNATGVCRLEQADYPRTIDSSSMPPWNLSSKGADEEADSAPHTWESFHHPFENMVLLFKRAHDPMKQDIIHIRDIIDRKTHQPSWTRLIKTLEATADGRLGLGFKNSNDFLMVDGQITVENDRQFLASLQYLHNAGKMNVVTTVLERPSQYRSIPTKTTKRHEVFKRLKWTKAFRSVAQRSGKIKRRRHS